MMRAPLRLALAACAGALSVVGFAPFSVFPVPLLTIAILVALWAKSKSVRNAAALGFFFGLGLFGSGVSWIYISLHDHGGMPMPLAAFAVFLFCALLALFPAAAGAVFARLRCGVLARDVLLIAAVWSLSEWLRGWVMSGFPWLVMGYSQTPPSPLAGFAPVVGVYGVSFLMASLSAAVGLFWCVRPSRIPGLIVGMLLALMLLSGWMLARVEWTVPTGQSLSVRLLQPNIPQSLKWQPELVDRWLEENLRMIESNPAQLAVLPETTLPLSIEELPPGYLERISEAGRRAGGDVLFGVFTRELSDGRLRYFNSAVSMGTNPPQRYRKSHLVAFGEFSPPGLEWVYRWLSIPMSDQSAGPPQQPALSIGGQLIAVNICYEDAFGEEVIRSLPAANILLNITNTAWFGRSLAQPQHLQMSTMRALEAGRPMLRATNTGVTAVITPNGIVQAQAPEFQNTVLAATVNGYTGFTPYARTGNIIVIGIASLVLAVCLVRRRI